MAKKPTYEELENMVRQLEGLINTAKDVIYTLTTDGTITYLNDAWQVITGYSKSEWLGKSFTGLLHPDDLLPIQVEFQSVISNKTPRTIEGRYKHKSGLYRIGEYTLKPKIDNNKVVNIVGIARDITERKQAEEKIKASLKEKELMLREIHHRVKNNMQIISSLLNLQAQNIKDKESLEMFKESQNRVRSMALIHERLYQSKDFTRIDFADYVQGLISHVFTTYRVSPSPLTVKVDTKDMLLDINTAIPCGLIINELISNSMKHAFPDGRKGRLTVSMKRINKKKIELMISDTGIGFPEDIDFRNTDTLGLQLVITLVEQLDGTIELDRSKGTAFKIIFGELKYKKRM